MRVMDPDYGAMVPISAVGRYGVKVRDAEKFLVKLWKEFKGIDLPTPFLRMTWHEAMERFGSDKPDIRFGFELINLSDLLANTEFKVFAGGHVHVQRGLFGEIADTRLGFDRIFVDVVAADGDFPFGRGETAGDNVHGCGFSGAVGANHADDAVRRKHEVEVAEEVLAAE